MRIPPRSPQVTTDLQNAKGCVEAAAEFVERAALGGLALNPEARLFDSGSSFAANLLGAALYVPNLASAVLLGAVSLGAAGVWASRAGYDVLRGG